VIKVWVPKFEEFDKLRASWMEEWNKTYGYRQ
jgi:iron(III) transport system substrate-binding protein